jgi:hypothetical protein
LTEDDSECTKEDVVRKVVGYFRNRFLKLNPANTVVIIERQFYKNLTAYVTQHAIVAFFLTLGVRSEKVHIVQAKSKHIPKDVTGKKRKSQRTLLAMTREMVEEHCSNAEEADALLMSTLSKMEGRKKTDDICDCFLQLIGNMNKI